MTPKQKIKKANLDYNVIDKVFILIKTKTFNVKYNVVNGKWYVQENHFVGQGVDKMLDFIRRYNGKRIS